jgi:hypothetical protein
MQPLDQFLNLITPAASYPITLQDLLDQCSLDDPSGYYTNRLNDLIAVATEFMEHETNRSYVVQTWQQTLPYFPSHHHGYYNESFLDVGYYPRRHHVNRLQISRPPLQSVNFVKYYDTTNTLQTMSSSDYRVITPGTAPGWLEPTAGYWPATYCETGAAVMVEFVAGYSTPPALVQHGIKLIAAAWNANREAEITGTISKTLDLGLDRICGLLSTGVYI